MIQSIKKKKIVLRSQKKVKKEDDEEARRKKKGRKNDADKARKKTQEINLTACTLLALEEGRTLYVELCIVLHQRSLSNECH